MNSATWWIWSISLTAAALRGGENLILIITILIIIFIVAKRGTDTLWGRSFNFALQIAISAMVIRFIFAVIIGTYLPGNVVFTLPQLQMPQWLAGVRIGGEVTEQRLLSVLDESLTFALIVIAFGAATALSSPIQIIKMMSKRLYLFGVTLIIAFSVLPQILASYQRVKMARKFRGEAKINLRNFNKVLTPVLEESLERAIDLSAAMESRGFGYSKKPTSYRAESFTFVDYLVVALSIYLLIFLPTLISTVGFSLVIPIFTLFAMVPLLLTKPMAVKI
jgi:energy-coupling factor transport system permease protein